MKKASIVGFLAALVLVAVNARPALAEPRYASTYQEGNVTVFVTPTYAVGSLELPLHNDTTTYRQWLLELGYIYVSANVQCYIPPNGTVCGSNYFKMYGFIDNTWEAHTCVYNPWPFADCYTSVREIRAVAACTDNDNDGFMAEGGDCGPADCDDSNPDVNPGTAEICDGLDNNCNAEIDEGVTTTFFRDADNDTFGDPMLTAEACSLPTGYSVDSTDCDDTRALVNPAAADRNVDGTDQNCDGVDGPIRTTLHFPAVKDGPHSDGLWRNYLSIQARNPAHPVEVTFLLHNSDGSLRASISDTTPVNGRLVKTPNWLMHAALNVEPFDGTVTVEAAAPILGMMNTIPPGSRAYDTYESPLAGHTLFFPASYDTFTNGNGFKNILHLQNIAADPVVVSVQYIDDWHGKVTDTRQIPGFGEYEAEVGTVFGNDFNGSIKVNASGDMAGMLRYEYLLANRVESTTIYEATMELTAIYFPYIRDGFDGNKNYYSIMNTSQSPATCSFSFYPPAGDTGAGPVFVDGPVVIPPGGRYTTTPSWARYGDLSHDFSGAISGFCDQPVAATVNVILPQVAGYSQYEAAVPRGALIFPQIYDNVGGYTNEVHLFNPNQTAVKIALELYFTDGTMLGAGSATLQPFGKYVARPYTLNSQSGVYQTNGSLNVLVPGGQRITGVLDFSQGSSISVYEAVSP